MIRRPPQVALLIESSRAYGRGLLHGIAGYARLHGPWSIYHHERALNDPTPAWLRGWKGHGVIARIENADLVKTLRRLNRPTVDLRGLHDLPPGLELEGRDTDAILKGLLEKIEAPRK